MGRIGKTLFIRKTMVLRMKDVQMCEFVNVRMFIDL